MKRKITKKILQIVLIVLAVFIALDLLAVGLLFVPPIQQKVVTLVTDKLSEKWHSKITIGSIYLSPTLKLTAREFCIHDHKGNTMIGADKLSSRLKKLQLSPIKVELYPIDSEGIKVILRKYKGDDSINISLWAQNFKKDKKNPSPFVMHADEIVLRNAYFLLQDDAKRLSTRTEGIDYAYLELKDIDWKLEDFLLNGSDISAHFDHLAFTQYSGFVLDNLNCDFRINSTGLWMKEATLVTPSSHIFMDFAFTYDNWKDLGDFLNKARFDVTMQTSTFNMREIGYFAPAASGMDNQLVLNCRLTGPINDMILSRFDVRYADSTQLAGQMRMRNITDFFNADIQMDLADNKVDFGELQRFLLPGGKGIPIPKMLANLGTARADITYDGVASKEFAATAVLDTKAGKVDATLDTRLHPDDNGIDYEAEVKTNGVNIGRFVPQVSMIGTSTLMAKASGSVGDVKNLAKTLTADVYARVSRMNVKGYPLRNLVVDGYYGRNKLSAELSVNDPNCVLRAEADLALAKRKKDYEFTASIDSLNATRMFAHLAPVDSLKAKGFDKVVRYVQQHPEMKVSLGEAGCSLTGGSLQEMAGSIYIDGISYQQDGKSLNADRIRLAVIPQDDQRVLRLTSDLLNVALTTNHDWTDIPDALLNLVYTYCGNFLPERKNKAAFAEGVAPDAKPRFMEMEAEIYHLKPVLDMFVPNIQLADNVYVKVVTDDAHLRDELAANVPYLNVGKGVSVNNLVVDGTPAGSKKMDFDISVNAVSVGANGNFVIDDIRLMAGLTPERIDYKLKWQNPESISQHQSLLAGEVAFPSQGIVSTRITDAEVYLKEAPITFNQDNLITLDHGVASFHNVRAFSTGREMQLNGKFGGENDSLVAIIQNFDIDIANQFIKTDKMQLDGDLSANMQIRTYQGKRIVVGALMIDDFIFNGADFGNLYANALLPSDHNIHFRGGFVGDEDLPDDATVFNYTYRDFQSQEGVSTRLSGLYDTDLKELRVTADMDSLPLSFLEPILSSFSHKFEGDASGKLNFVMKKDSLYFDGLAHVKKAQMGIAPLNTIYNIENQDVYFDKNGFEFQNMLLTDAYDNHATLTGYIHHRNFQNFDLNLNISTPKIYVLDTKQTSDSPFYGQGFVSGNIAIYGNTEKLYFAGSDIATEKGTVFCLPISFADKVYDSDVITFKQAEREDGGGDEPVAEPSAMEMDFDFTFAVTPDAVIRLDLDLSAFGGAIKTAGEGILHFKYNTSSDIDLMGDVQLQGGSFMMTFVDLVNKKFELQPGGVVSFNGPLDNMHISAQAMYSTSASLADLFTAENTNIRRMPVKAFLNFNGTLSDPAAIDFSFDLPNATSDFKTLFYSAIDTTNIQKKTEQFFSLVMLGKFASEQSSVANINLENTGIGVVTNTLSNLISNQLKYVDVNLNYQNASADNAAEYAVGASTSLFNDRTVIEGYFGYKDDKSQTDLSSQFIGDFSIEQKLNELGTWRLKVFNVTNQDELRNANRNSPYAQGVAIIYKQDFNNRKDIIESFKSTPRGKRKKKEKNKE